MAKLFISYSHADEALRGELTKHLSTLRREGLITTWYDREILPGSQIDAEISKHLEEADLALMLVSADFLNSDYCSSIELKRALERYQAGELRVIPVILRDCAWPPSPLGKLNALPADGRAVTGFPDRDTAFADIARAIRRVLVGPKAKATPEWGSATPPSQPSPPNPASKTLLKRKLTDADREHEVLYPRLVSGEALIIDDYGMFQGSRRATDEYFAKLDKPPLLNRIDVSVWAGVKG
jgi:TIR domain/Macrocin-O-methyltransferase (TylF)